MYLDYDIFITHEEWYRARLNRRHAVQAYTGNSIEDPFR